MKTLIIYHGGCPDGITSAFAVWHSFNLENRQAIEFFAGVHGQDPPDVTGKSVIIVDFSYKRAVLLEMATKATDITILDHHKSAERDLDRINEVAPNVTAYFDMSRSGAQMAWSHFNPTVDPPRFIGYIADRDLWRWALPNSKAMNEGIYHRIFRDWSNDRMPAILDDLLALSISRFREVIYNGFAAMGEEILEEKEKRINEVCSNAVKKVLVTPDGGRWNVMLVECPHHSFTSEVGNRLSRSKICEGVHFACMYRYADKGDEKNYMYISMRSSSALAPDLSVIASTLPDGGGHPPAAGWSIPVGKNLNDYFIDESPVKKYILLPLVAPRVVFASETTISDPEMVVSVMHVLDIDTFCMFDPKSRKVSTFSTNERVYKDLFPDGDLPIREVDSAVPNKLVWTIPDGKQFSDYFQRCPEDHQGDPLPVHPPNGGTVSTNPPGSV